MTAPGRDWQGGDFAWSDGTVWRRGSGSRSMPAWRAADQRRALRMDKDMAGAVLVATATGPVLAGGAAAELAEIRELQCHAESDITGRCAMCAETWPCAVAVEAMTKPLEDVQQEWGVRFGGEDHGPSLNQYAADAAVTYLGSIGTEAVALCRTVSTSPWVVVPDGE